MIFLGGLRRVRTDRAAILTYAEPVSAVILAAMFLGEPLTVATIVGGTMVVAGGVVVTRLGGADEREPTSLEAAGVEPE
jgi:drug/metabolite transporter (DMT)-like permease